MSYKIIDDSPIELSKTNLSINALIESITRTNLKFKQLSDRTAKMNLDVFDIIDFRVFSGLVGETLITDLADINNQFEKNPNLDGYPDLLQIANNEMRQHYNEAQGIDFINFKYGGIEVKNTFGTKKSGANLIQGDSRIEFINEKLDWKAHHRNTNNLLGLFSDYYQGFPIIIAAFYCDDLNADDWNAVQRPKKGSAMTSFSTISADGFKKMKARIKVCYNNEKYLKFFDIN